MKILAPLQSELDEIRCNKNFEKKIFLDRYFFSFKVFENRAIVPNYNKRLQPVTISICLYIQIAR